MACNCIEQTNTALKPMNARLVLSFNLRTGEVWSTITTERIENRRDGKKAPTVLPTYCPFCGVSQKEGAR